MFGNILSAVFSEMEYGSPARTNARGACNCGCTTCQHRATQGEVTYVAERYRSFNTYYGIEDFTSRADLGTCAKNRQGKSCTGGKRSLAVVDAIVLHQTGGSQSIIPDNYLWVGAHYVVMPNGRIIQLHTEDKNIYHANSLNTRSVGIEFAGTFPNEAGICHWSTGVNKPRGFRSGQRACASPTAAQYAAGRLLVTALTEKLPGIRYIFAHRQASGTRDNDPGPELWQNVGEWALVNLGLSNGPTSNYKAGTGKPIPPSWRLPMTAGEFERSGLYRQVKGNRAAKTEGHHIHQKAAYPARHHGQMRAVELPGDQHQGASALQRALAQVLGGRQMGDKTRARLQRSGVSVQATGQGNLPSTPNPWLEDVKAFYGLRAAGLTPDRAYVETDRSGRQNDRIGNVPVRVSAGEMEFTF